MRPWRDIAVLGLTSSVYFLAFGATLPVVSRHILALPGGDERAVGLAFAGHALAAIAARPLLGRLTDHRGRRHAIAVGGLITSVGLAVHLFAGTIFVMVLGRSVVGVGQAAVIVGATTLMLDLAPDDRRAELSGYLLVAFQVGMGLGPFGGETLAALVGTQGVWVVTAALSAACAPLILLVRGEAPMSPSTSGRSAILHAAALRPALVQGLGCLGFVAFLAFAPVLGAERGMERVGILFLVASGSLIVVRMATARLPDRVGPVRPAAIGLAVSAVGLAGLVVPGGVTMLVGATMLMGAGLGLTTPALVLSAADGVPRQEIGVVMATFTLSADVASAVGPVLLGVLAVHVGVGGAFAGTAVAATVALLLLFGWRVRLGVGARPVAGVVLEPGLGHDVRSPAWEEDPGAR